MKYKGKSVEIIGSKTLFGKETLWVHILEDNSFEQVLRSDLEEDHVSSSELGMSYVRYMAVATRIKEEISQKRLLAPYESSLIPLPHQILVLEKVMQGIQTRYLLADEVGMGKTIEAGLVLKEKKLRGEVKRILLIVPKSAMLQWQQELKEHFNENFYIYNSDFISGMARTFADFDAEEELNFWKQHNQIIVSLDALKPLAARQGWSQERINEYNKYRLESVVNADFDMVVIDEAHRMGGSTGSVSRYQLADTICNAVPNVLLLSATPHRGKSDHFRRMLQLIDADAFSGEGMPTVEEISPFVMRSEKRYAVDYDGNKLFQKRITIRMDVPLDNQKHPLQKQLYEDVTQYVRYQFGKAQRVSRNSTGLVMVMFQKLASSSTAALLGAMQTRLCHLEQGEIGDELSDYEAEENVGFEDFSVDDYSVDIQDGSSMREEDKLRELIHSAQYCLAHEQDAKASALIQKIYQLKAEEDSEDFKILVFTEFRQTQEYLVRLMQDEGLHVVCINGSMELNERQQALVKFKTEAQVMIATDAAGESLNMQFCHIVFNYDLPWNPMSIEQRIGRVDRIGQKHTVTAYNMLTDNTVDTRVYEVIVEKLESILQELGIDKTNDVLDSTIDQHQVNNLYLQSLLDPKRFEFATDSWLFEIKNKLRDFKSTEGALPTFAKEEINKRSAGEVKYSPLPVWLEEMMDLYTQSQHGHITKLLGGVSEYSLGEKTLKVYFDATMQGNNPGIDYMTLQHPEVKRILNEVDGNTQTVIPVIRSVDGGETPGFLTLWKVTAKNSYETKSTYVAQYITDNGRVFQPYGNDIWNRLVQDKISFSYEGEQENSIDLENNAALNNNLHAIFHRMETDIQNSLQIKAERKLKSFEYTKYRIHRIGIENIRKAKLAKLETQQKKWENVVAQGQSVVPDVKHLLTVRVDG